MMIVVGVVNLERDYTLHLHEAHKRRRSSSNSSRYAVVRARQLGHACAIMVSKLCYDMGYLRIQNGGLDSQHLEGHMLVKLL